MQNHRSWKFKDHNMFILYYEHLLFGPVVYINQWDHRRSNKSRVLTHTPKSRQHHTEIQTSHIAHPAGPRTDLLRASSRTCMWFCACTWIVKWMVALRSAFLAIYINVSSTTRKINVRHLTSQRIEKPTHISHCFKQGIHPADAESQFIFNV